MASVMGKTVEEPSISKVSEPPRLNPQAVRAMATEKITKHKNAGLRMPALGFPPVPVPNTSMRTNYPPLAIAIGHEVLDGLVCLSSNAACILTACILTRLEKTFNTQSKLRKNQFVGFRNNQGIHLENTKISLNRNFAIYIISLGTPFGNSKSPTFWSGLITSLQAECPILVEPPFDRRRRAELNPIA